MNVQAVIMDFDGVLTDSKDGVKASLEYASGIDLSDAEFLRVTPHPFNV